MATALKQGTGVPASFTGSVTRVDSAQKYPAGQLRLEDGKWYKYVKYNQGAGAVAAVAGNVAYYYGAGGAPNGHANSEVTSDLSDSVEIGAGVLQAVIANGSWGWIQIKGAATITPALTAGADGDPLTPTGATDGTLDVTALATDHVCVYAEDASAKTIICDFPW